MKKSLRRNTVKKKYICTFLFYLLLSTTIISTTKKITATYSLEKQEQTDEHFPYEEEMEDDLDHLIENAIEVGLVKNEIVAPSIIEVILTRAAIIFILKPYLYFMTQYENAKDWLVAVMRQLGYYKEEEQEKEEETESPTRE